MAEFDSAIPPGGTGTIRARVKTKGIQGRRVKSITVRTNDPARPRLRLEIAFDVRPPILVRPAPQVTLSAVEGRPVTQSIELVRDDGAPLEILSATTDRRGARVTVEPVPEGGDPARRRLTIALDAAAGGRSEAGRIHVETDDPRRPQLDIPLRIQVRELVVTAPRRLDVTLRPGQEPATLRVTLRASDARRFAARAAHVEGIGSGVEPRVVSEAPSTTQVVEVRVSGEGLPPGVHRGRVVVELNRTRKPRVEIPLVVRVVSASATH